MSVKDDYLKKTGCFYENHASVTAEIFGISPFFDKRDIVQVKYEMVRAASKREGSITEVASAYGFSRKSYYQISGAFAEGGIIALVPKKTGPKSPSKLTLEVQSFIDSFSSEHKNAKSTEISAALENEKGVKVHPRTIYRYLKKK